MAGKIITRIDGGIGEIVLDQPDKLNAISYEMWLGIFEAVKNYADIAAVRVIVVSGAGAKAFSAGADISQFEKKRGTEDAVEQYNRATKQAYAALENVRKPTIAKVKGYCIGGGLATALCCDLRIASSDSQFAIPAAKLGLGYSYDALKPLVDIVGPTNAKEILYTARKFDAHEAKDMGLVNRVVDRQKIDAYTLEYAQTIADNAPLTVGAVKRVVGELVKDPGERDMASCAQVIDDCFASDDYKEGREAFMEKRKPSFQGK